MKTGARVWGGVVATERNKRRHLSHEETLMLRSFSRHGCVARCCCCNERDVCLRSKRRRMWQPEAAKRKRENSIDVNVHFDKEREEEMSKYRSAYLLFAGFHLVALSCDWDAPQPRCLRRCKAQPSTSVPQLGAHGALRVFRAARPRNCVCTADFLSPTFTSILREARERRGRGQRK